MSWIRLQKEIIMQGQFSNREMVRLHKERIDQGRTSVLMGLASFAEGVDLPGDYCQACGDRQAAFCGAR